MSYPATILPRQIDLRLTLTYENSFDVNANPTGDTSSTLLTYTTKYTPILFLIHSGALFLRRLITLTVDSPETQSIENGTEQLKIPPC